MGLSKFERLSSFSPEQALYTIEKVQSDKNPEEGYSFDAIKKYIINSPAYYDLNSRIRIEKDVIYFGHSLPEIQMLFPSLPGLIMTRPYCPFTEANVNPRFGCGHKSVDAVLTSQRPIKTQQQDLKQEAKEFFNRLSKIRVKPSPLNVQQSQEPSSLLLDLVDHNQSVVIGERHGDKSSKKLLIDMMPQLRSKGVEVIYLEHVLFDTQKEMLDAYFASDSLVMPIPLANYLRYLDEGFELQRGGTFSPYTFTGLVVQAKRCGIKILPFDTVASYTTAPEGLSVGDGKTKDFNDRCLMMNYVAAKQYQENKTPHQKAIFFVGSKHINAVNSGVIGLDELTDSPTLVVEDIKPNTKPLLANEHIAKPDFLICMTDERSAAAEELVSVYQNDLDSVTPKTILTDVLTDITADLKKIKTFLSQYVGETTPLLRMLEACYRGLDAEKGCVFLQDVSGIMRTYPSHAINPVLFSFLESLALSNTDLVDNVVLNNMIGAQYGETKVSQVNNLVAHFGQQKHYELALKCLNLYNQTKNTALLKRAAIEAKVEGELHKLVGRWYFGIVSTIRRWWHYGFQGMKNPTGLIMFSDDHSSSVNPEKDIEYIEDPALPAVSENRDWVQVSKKDETKRPSKVAAVSDDGQIDTKSLLALSVFYEQNKDAASTGTQAFRLS